MYTFRSWVVPITSLVVLTSARADTGGSFTVQADVVPALLLVGDNYGSSVAIDGDRIAVGAPVGNGGVGPGRVIVLERQGGSWVETATIVVPGLPDGSRFGTRVDLVGDTLFANAVTGTTEAYVFEFDGAVWNQAALVVAAPPNSATTSSVAASGDTLVLGTGASAPRVHVFERIGTDWSQTQETVLVASDGQNLGPLVAIDGDVLVAGAPSATAAGEQLAGRVYVFERVAGQWNEVANLAGSIVDSGFSFGSGVSVRGDWIAASTPLAPVQSVSQAGFIDLIHRENGTWQHHQMIGNPTPTLLERFGYALSLSADRLLVGTLGQGGAWLFSLSDDLWVERAELVTPPNGAGFGPGGSLALDGDRVVLGEPLENLGAINTGSVHIYERVPLTPVAYCTAKTTTEGCAPAVGWNGGASLTGTDDFAVLARDVPPGKTGLFFWGTSGKVAVPFLGGTLCVAPSLTRGPVLLSSGAVPCDGGFVLPFTQALMSQEGLDVCQAVHGQWWMRDPQNPDGTGVALTDGIEFTIDF